MEVASSSGEGKVACRQVFRRVGIAITIVSVS